MADENVLALLQEIRAGQREMKADIARVDSKVDRLTTRADRMDAKLDRAAIRADDVMGSQVRMATDIAALRAIQEECGREVVDEFREDLGDLRDRVEALEARNKS